MIFGRLPRSCPGKFGARKAVYGNCLLNVQIMKASDLKKIKHSQDETSEMTGRRWNGALNWVSKIPTATLVPLPKRVNWVEGGGWQRGKKPSSAVSLRDSLPRAALSCPLVKGKLWPACVNCKHLRQRNSGDGIFFSLFFLFRFSFFNREFSIKASIYPAEPLRAARFLRVRSSARRYATTQTETPGMTRPACTKKKKRRTAVGSSSKVPCRPLV